MHRKAWLSAFAALALSGTLAVAQTTSSDTSSSSSSKQMGSSTSGQMHEHGHAMNLKVKSIDTKNNVITFEAPLASNVKVDQNGQPITLDQVKEGDQVRAAFDAKTGSVLRIDLKKSSSQQQNQAQPQGSQNQGTQNQ